MDPEEEKKKKLNDDVVVFLRKRSETETPRYAARLHAYVDLQRKRSRVAAAKKRSEHGHERKISANRKKGDLDQKDKNAENTANNNSARRSTCGFSGEGDDDRMSRRRGGDKSGVRNRSLSRSRSVEPYDKCGRRRRRRRSCSRRRRRRRRRSGRRRRRRRRSCGRRRRRRRSSSRRRRRRSCRRKRRRRRRCR